MLISDGRSGLDKKICPPALGLLQPYSRDLVSQSDRPLSASLSTFSTSVYRRSAWQPVLSGPLPLFTIACLFNISSPLSFRFYG